MKKKLKVYLQYPWKFPDSPYYKYLVDSPPEGVEFLNANKEKGVITNKRFFWFSNFLKRNIRRWTNKFNLAIPNAHLSPNGDYDLIHCAHCLSKNKNKPWVADIESWWSMYLSGYYSEAAREKVEKILLSENCKKIMPWTEATKKDILERFPKLESKIEVVYPAVPVVKNLKKPKNKKLKVIFIARYFDIKGGLIALEVLENLRKNYGIDGVVVSDVSKELKNKYSKLKIYDLLPQKKLFELMRKSNIFLYPGSVDTFGFSLLEAMAFGLPVITINTNGTKSRKEIVENRKTGFIFDVNEKLSFNEIGDTEKKVIKKLVRNVSKLIENKKLREKILKECIKTIKDGKFSIKERNKKLKRIYAEIKK
jgi:glycosyltransferase involved in cell wall biosynthesis